MVLPISFLVFDILFIVRGVFNIRFTDHRVSHQHTLGHRASTSIYEQYEIFEFFGHLLGDDVEIMIKFN